MTQPAGEEILLDATAMEPPEPLQRATSILQKLEHGQYLRMLHRRLPHPLLESCEQLEVSYRHFAAQEDTRESKWVILFWRSDDPITAKFCGQLQQ